MICPPLLPPDDFHSDAANCQSLVDLLGSFFQFYVEPFKAWSQGRQRDRRVNSWLGRWAVMEPWPARYFFSVEDPFNHQDNTARAVGKGKGSLVSAQFIAFKFQQASEVMSRCLMAPQGGTPDNPMTFSYLFGPLGVGALDQVAPSVCRHSLNISAATLDHLRAHLGDPQQEVLRTWKRLMKELQVPQNLRCNLTLEDFGSSGGRAPSSQSTRKGLSSRLDADAGEVFDGKWSYGKQIATSRMEHQREDLQRGTPEEPAPEAFRRRWKEKEERSWSEGHGARPCNNWDARGDAKGPEGTEGSSRSTPWVQSAWVCQDYRSYSGPPASNMSSSTDPGGGHYAPSIIRPGMRQAARVGGGTRSNSWSSCSPPAGPLSLYPTGLPWRSRWAGSQRMADYHLSVGRNQRKSMDERSGRGQAGECVASFMPSSTRRGPSMASVGVPGPLGVMKEGAHFREFREKQASSNGSRQFSSSPDTTLNLNGSGGLSAGHPARCVLQHWHEVGSV